MDVISGEVHYWRLNALFWGNVLQVVKAAGFELVSTYVPYEYHEHEPGKFDFTGETYPSRDLVGFLRLCRDMGFKVLIRPGPVIAAEWRNRGLPDHIENDPFLRVSTNAYRFQDGFRIKLNGYFKSLCDAVCPFQFPEGPIVAWQVDNEMGGMGYISTESQTGLEARIYREFLAERYGSVDAVNRAYGTEFVSFEEVSYPTGPGELSRPQKSDMFTLSDYVVGKAVDGYKDALVRNGVRVPFYLNFTVTPTRDWEACERHADFVGVDMYLHDLIPWEEHLFFARTIKYLASVAKLPWSPEFQAGIWPYLYDRHGRGVSARHIWYMTMVAMATGLKGFNYYMLVNRDNWFMSPIDDVGTPLDVKYPEKRHGLAEMIRAVKVIREHNLPSYNRRTKIALVWYRPHYLQETLEKGARVPEGLKYEELEKPCCFDYTEFWDLLRALSEADIDFDLLDLEKAGAQELTRYEAVLYGGKPGMDRDNQAKLAGYSQSGGRLIVCGAPPEEDLSGQECRILGTRRSEEAYKQATHDKAPESQVRPGNTPSRAGADRGGCVIVRSPAGAVRYLESSDVDLSVRSGTTGVLTYLHSGDPGELLYIVNTLPTEQIVSIARVHGAMDLVTGQTVLQDRVHIPGKDVKVLLLIGTC